MLKKHFWITNFVLFQTVWFVCALLSDIASLAVIVIILFHCFLTPTLKKDALLAGIVVVIGTLIDFILTQIGLLGFSSADGFLPFWLILLWLYFATTYNHALSWLKRLPAYGLFVFGAVLGPLSYYAAAKLDVLQYNVNDIDLLLIHVISWGVLNVCFVQTSKYIDASIFSPAPS